MKITSEQLKQLHQQIEKYSKTSMFYKVDYVKIMYHPSTPDNIYLKVRSHGVADGRPFDEISYKNIDMLGNVTDPALTFQKLEDRIHFYAEMREVALKNGNLEFI